MDHDDVITVGGRPHDWTFEVVGNRAMVEVTVSYRDGHGKVNLDTVQTIEIDARDAVRLADALRQGALQAGRVCW